MAKGKEKKTYLRQTGALNKVQCGPLHITEKLLLSPSDQEIWGVVKAKQKR